MDNAKFDIVQIIMQPYILDLLKELKKPRRFNDLRKTVKNGRTLTLKLQRLRKYGLIEDFALKTEKGFVNSYIISKKGKDIISKLEKI
ncbi:MAG: winged helix-turn-helix transcriptional regulator [Candidatus Micrarchaeales archaeon]